MDDEARQGGYAPYPNMASVAFDGMRSIFRTGILHAAFELRGTDFDGIPDEHLDRMADYLEKLARQENISPAVWPLPTPPED